MKKIIFYITLAIISLSMQVKANEPQSCVSDTTINDQQPIAYRFLGVEGNIKEITYSVHADTWIPVWVCSFSPDATIAGACEDYDPMTDNTPDSYSDKYCISFDPKGRLTTPLPSPRNVDITLGMLSEQPVISLSDSTYQLELRSHRDGLVASYIMTYQDEDEYFSWSIDKAWLYEDGCPVIYSSTDTGDGISYTTATYKYDYDGDYDANILVSSIVSHVEGNGLYDWHTAIIEYTDYEFDDQGNWISRQGIAEIRPGSINKEQTQDQEQSITWTESREIEYY